ncbi:TIGR02588 family protein [Pararhizobium sp. BT-229]|uniref:TIGR02588 family protein n=1 Tax=Pararhizobium sp. BT-229 TaxID=2986923 RepID=UPI0021F732B1|nr:TIGR02588 family protein [Pararhizobium sp. BT-229]MCV9962923.1 TIGR02588 family protein [Pararhizobium sp. BT-229]
MADEKPGKRNGRTVARGAHWIEWVTGGLCTVVVAAMTLWIAYHAIASSGGTPELFMRIIDQHPVSGGHEVSFVIDNSGTRTAAAVPVIGELKDGDTVIETREITLDYVPAQSAVSGALLFKADPSLHVLEIRAAGYADP